MFFIKKYTITFKFSIFFIFIALGVLLTSCTAKYSYNKSNNSKIGKINSNSNIQNSGNNQEINYTINDYYPFKKNVRMSYAGKGNEYAAREVYVDFVKGNKAQLRSINGGTTVGQVIQSQNGELSLIYYRGEFYYRDDLTSLQNPTKEVILKEPLIKGTSWTLTDGRKRAITGTDIAVETPSGKYKALEVTTHGDNYTTKDYYVLNTGLIKSITVAGGSEISTSLKKIILDAPVVQSIKFYYPKVTKTDVTIMYKNNSVNLNTNDEIKNIFEKSFKKPLINNTLPLMSENTKINRLYLNYKDNVVNVDFSKEFITEMNAGTSKEMGVLRSVVNTLGDYYNVNKVHISIDGKEYSSGHILMKQGENFDTDYKGVIEIK